MTDPVVCAFCKIVIEFSRLSVENVILITVERDYDGAAIWCEYWAHEACLPEALK